DLRPKDLVVGQELRGRGRAVEIAQKLLVGGEEGDRPLMARGGVDQLEVRRRPGRIHAQAHPGRKVLSIRCVIGGLLFDPEVVDQSDVRLSGRVASRRWGGGWSRSAGARSRAGGQ